MLRFLLMALLALTAENVLFTRALGVNQLLWAVERPRRMGWFGLLLALSTLLTGLISWTFRSVVLALPLGYISQPVSYILMMAVVYTGVWLFFRYGFSGRYRERFDKLRRPLEMAVCNMAVLGALTFPSFQNAGFLETIGYGLGSSAGFLLAMVLVREGELRLEMCNVPRAFRGLPVTLIYIGLISLAFYGLVGHQLPT